MYGQFKYDSMRSNDQYSNQQQLNKDDYSIKNTQQCLNKSDIQYSIKQETNLGQLNENEIEQNLQTLNQSITQSINSPTDQWPLNNYYDQNSYASSLLTPDSQQSIQHSIQSNVICNQSNLTNLQQPTNLQPNLQLNIQLNVQSNLHPPIDNSSSVQTSIQQSVVQQSIQHQFTNQFSTNQLNQLPNRLTPQSSKHFNQTFNDYSKDAPLTKKIKSEKNNFNLNYNQQNVQADYFSNSNQIRQTNQMQNTNFQLQCDLPYANNQQQLNQSGNSFQNNLLSNNGAELNNLSPSTDYYIRQQTNMTNIDQSIATISYQQQQQPQSIKSDQLGYSNLNNSLNNNLNNERNTQKKLQDTNNLAKQQANLSNQTNLQQQPIQTTRSLSSNFTANSLDSYSNLQLTNANQTHSNFNQQQHSSATRQLDQNKQFLNSIKCQKSILNVKRSIRQELKASIQTRLQNQMPFRKFDNSGNNNLNSISSSSIKLVDKRELVVPNCKLNSSNKINQIKSNLSKSTSVLLDEEEKRKRRRERNKVC